MRSVLPIHLLAFSAMVTGCGPGTWLSRYDKAIDALETGYAFTEHKQLDWAEIDGQVRPLVREAADGADPDGLDAALRQLVAAIPDNHIELDATDCEHTEASFGVVLSDTDDQGVIVARVLDTDLDLAPGTQVRSWNGVAIDRARSEAPTDCLNEGIATVERLAFEQLRFLTRGAEGATAQLGTDAGDHTLTAVFDDDEALQVFEYPKSSSDAVTHRIDGDIGVLTIATIGGSRTEAKTRKAIAAFLEADVRGVVLDLRGNNGGSDDLAARLAGFFNASSRFYQHEAYPDANGEFAIDLTYIVEPQDIRWTGPTAVLVDGFTVSSGEGLAMAASWREDAVVVGFERSAASFGFTGGSVGVAGRKVHFPEGQSWDIDERVQLDSDASMRGGVAPDHRVPWSVENRLVYAAGEDVVLEVATGLLPR